jgi:hypothetical protein
VFRVREMTDFNFFYASCQKALLSSSAEANCSLEHSNRAIISWSTTHANRAVIPFRGALHTSIRSVIPRRLHDDYEEQNYLERNPVDGNLSMKCTSWKVRKATGFRSGTCRFS